MKAADGSIRSMPTDNDCFYHAVREFLAPQPTVAELRHALAAHARSLPGAEVDNLLTSWSTMQDAANRHAKVTNLTDQEIVGLRQGVFSNIVRSLVAQDRDAVAWFVGDLDGLQGASPLEAHVLEVALAYARTGKAGDLGQAAVQEWGAK